MHFLSASNVLPLAALFHSDNNGNGVSDQMACNRSYCFCFTATWQNKDVLYRQRRCKEESEECKVSDVNAVNCYGFGSSVTLRENRIDRN